MQIPHPQKLILYFYTVAAHFLTKLLKQEREFTEKFESELLQLELSFYQVSLQG